MDTMAHLTDLESKLKQLVAAAKACREAQGNYFKARKAGFSGHEELGKSKKAEKALDDMIKDIDRQLAPPPAQQSIF